MGERCNVESDPSNLLNPCPACAAAMPPAYRYCGMCGASLHHACPSCGESLPLRYRFCGMCGTALPQSGAPTPLPPPRRPTPAPPSARTGTEAQRRRVAILFADLTGSTAMTERLEVETAYAIVSDCLRGLGQVVAEEGGYVAKTLGDGLMALFGAPTAHGDDPLRAGRAALRLQEWMARFSQELEAQHGVRLRMRVGINYGSVVAAPLAAGDRREYDVLGDAVNVAQRTEAAAEPGTVCVSEAFYRVTRAAFEYRDRGLAEVKGKAEPLHLFELSRERPSGAGETLLPLVGREPEMARLRDAADALAAGNPDLLALTGESGMGKSRLLEELSLDLAGRGIPHLRGAGAEGRTDAPLALWRGWLLEFLPVHPSMRFEEAVSAVRGALPGEDRGRWAEWLAALAVDPARLPLSETEGRVPLLRGALRSFLDYWQGGRPAALLVDEAASLDPLSLQLLAETGTARGESPLLVVLAGRGGPRFPPPEVEALALKPLAVADVERLVSSLFPGPIPEEAQRLVVERSGGQPLVLDLMLRAAREAPDPAAALIAVPDTVYGLVQAQVDALSEPERGTARRASVLGRTFAERWLARLCSAAPGAAPWSSLERREVLAEHRPAPDRELTFRHGAFREVLYEGMLGDQRREEHVRATAILAEEAAGSPGLAGLVAQHYLAAGLEAEALPWLLRAADDAAALFAAETAERLYGECLSLAERADDPAARARALAGLATGAAHGGNYPAALERYQEAEAALEALPASMEDHEVLAARIGRAHARVLAQTGALTAAMERLAQAEPVLAAAADAREYSGCLTEKARVLLEQGLPAEAKPAALQAMELAEAGGWQSEAAAAGAVLGRIYPVLGEPEAAERVLRRAAALAEGCADWQAAAACRINLGQALQQACRFAEAEAAYEQALEDAGRVGDAEKCALVRMNLGVVLLNRGAWDRARAAFEGASGQFRAMGHALGVAASLYNLADTLRWSGEPDTAIGALEQAETALAEVEFPYLELHLQLARAELRLALDDREPAEELAAAVVERAEALEYESGVSLARLTLGRARRAAGDAEGAAAALQAALTGFERSGEPLEGARARAELAAAVALLGEADRAERLHQDACEALRQLGAEPWLEHLPPPEPTSPSPARTPPRTRTSACR